MDISNFALKPTLVDIILDDKDIIENYGTSITFKMPEHLDVTTYFAFYRAQQSDDGAELNKVLQKIIRKSDGTSALKDGEFFPVDISVGAVLKISDQLGKSKAQAILVSVTATTVD